MLDMEKHASQLNRRSDFRFSTKSKAPSPPAQFKGLDGPIFSQKYPGYPHLTMDQVESLIEKDLTLVVVLPGGVEKETTVHGSKPMMDLLVMLCAKYHLNPSSHTIELVTTNRNHIKFKPNALIGALEAERILLKPRGGEDKNKKTGPQMPEATVRMVINYRKTQKTILRVNPRIPLVELLPAICDKCEFEVETTVLLREIQSQAPLDLSSSLNDHGIREVYAWDTKVFSNNNCVIFLLYAIGLITTACSVDIPASPTRRDSVICGKDKNQKEKENKGLFSMFRRSKKKPEQATTASAPSSPVLVLKPRPLSMALPSSHSYACNSTTMPLDVPKKRRAPPPPMLASQSCPSDIGTCRRRLNSEPQAQTDTVQMVALSRGSSAESSLKRTKRKAPPPPQSPSCDHDENMLDQCSKVGSAPTTLEEIVEQEETTASVASGAVSDAHSNCGTLNLSTDVSMDSPSLGGEMLNASPLEGKGEGQIADLSSYGKYEVSQSSQVLSEAFSFDIWNAFNVLCFFTDQYINPLTTSPGPTEHASDQSLEANSRGENKVKDECSSTSSPSLLAQPETHNAETQASVQVNTEGPWDETERLERPSETITPCLPGEDSQVQTDLTPSPLPSQPPPAQPLEGAPSLNLPDSVGQKRDMATSTEELSPPDGQPALCHVSRSSPDQALPQSGHAAAKAEPLYSTDSEPKPKPSNELTRDYIPKVGMTTYTIVPQKSLEKLRYFEVEVTLEAPPVTPEKEIDIGCLQLDSYSQERQGFLTQEADIQSITPKGNLSLSDSQSTVNDRMTEPDPFSSMPTQSLCDQDDKISSPTYRGLQVGSVTEVKEMRIPPATKPKPGSFRLAQHKRTPGYYVTSAAVKSLSSSPDAGQREAPGCVEKRNPFKPVEEVDLPHPPPHSPPVHCQKDATGGAIVEVSPKEEKKSFPFLRQSSMLSKEPSSGLSLEKLRSFAAPRPFSPTSPSRFAQAVSSAVKRSQSLSHGPSSPCSPPFSPVSGRFSLKEPKGLFNTQGSGNRKTELDESSVLERVVDDPLATVVTAPMEYENSPVALNQQCYNLSNGATQMTTEYDALPSSSPESSTQE
ncbi:cordon-bleu protein-like 1b [Aplochiton taeniatus]